MVYKEIIYEKEDRIAYVTLNRPKQHNALSNEMDAELHEVLNVVEQDDRIKVLVLKGAGPSFCVGHDLTRVGYQYGWTDPKPGEKWQRPNQRARLNTDRLILTEDLRRIFLFPKITIVQVHGYCIGEGFMMASMCDLALAAEDATFGRREQTLVFSGYASDFLILVVTIGLRRTMELFLTGRDISGREAEAIGLVNKAVPREKLEDETNKLAEQLCLLPADGIAIAKAGRHMDYESLGLLAGITHGYPFHTLHTNTHFEPDEFNFFKERRKKGSKEAIAERNLFFRLKESKK